MRAQTLIIQEKAKTGLGAVRPSDFRVRVGKDIDAACVLQNPNLSLYCLDFEKQTALFVETPIGVDLSEAAFFYDAQYQNATGLVEVPLETLHQLANQVATESARIILIYSVGRCGSTLVSRAFNAVKGVDSISEPDVFTQMLGQWGIEDFSRPHQAQLVRSCALLQCAPGLTRGATTCALKFRSMVTEMGPLIHSVLPQAKVVFIYRNVVPFLKSFLRMIGSEDPDGLMPLDAIIDMFGRAIPVLDSEETISDLEITTRMWARVMGRCLEMQSLNIPMFVFRYEELSHSPRLVLDALFEYCGIAADAVGDIDSVLAQDSQAGSQLARETIAGPSAEFTSLHLEKIRSVMDLYTPGVSPDSILPGTYFPV